MRLHFEIELFGRLIKKKTEKWSKEETDWTEEDRNFKHFFQNVLNLEKDGQKSLVCE